METDEIKIREFKHEDLGQILNFDSKDSKRRQDKFQRVELLDTYCAFVAERGEDIVGFIVLEDLSDGITCHLTQINVANDYKRNGIGSMLINHVFQYLGAGKRVTLNVNVANAPAIRLYESLGFERCGFSMHYRENQNKIWYTKKIS
jgi:ribosomal protein S18 acetylase RimI-like enzyme